MTLTGGGIAGSKSPTKIMANIFISFIGAGVLGLPFAFKEAGIIEGCCIMTIVGIISVKAMLLIIDCKHMLIHKFSNASPPPKMHQHSTVNSNSAKVFVPLPDINVSKQQERECLILEETIIDSNGIQPSVQIDEPTKPEAPGQELNYGDVGYYAIGGLGRFLVESALLISQVGFCCAYLIFISENLSDYVKGVQIEHWLGLLLPPLCLLTLVRHLGSLAYCRIHPKKISLKGFPFFLAVAIYCYEGAGMILSLESSLHKDVRHSFKAYFKVTITTVTVLYISFGACGYLSFGPETNAIITLNLPKGSSLDFAVLVKVCLCLGLFFTYPIMMFPVIELLEKKLLPDPEKKWQGNVLRFLMVGITGLIVLAIPNFANLMALVGATCCTLLAFILPGLFHLQIYKKYKGAVVGTWDAVKRLNLAPTLKDGGPWWNDTETTSIAQEMGHNLTNNLFSTIMDLSSNKTNTSEISTLS
ncbi:hypothetical protein LSH36_2g01039 [Paralvinella palmiformis]|uniref:Amino acid transporter transmembrane domain-containing protein n=1 Tax=Paralvinella palmiformis TaxID=53620 RepID=A0AAD9NKI4_9ANNE|nr:hypothetical protein LSH36_2g01039 [Paralvinella palmiformis]